MSDEGRLVARRYRIVRRIGSGAMGTVWQAYDEVLARTVAIKQLLLQPGLEHNEAEDAKQRTMREGRIAARLHHPNAITVFDVVTDDNGHPCLVMEYLPSTSLAEVLRDQKTLPPLEVARIGAQIAAALKEAHAVGIVHRDIKPGNILLADNGVVKITDFGISRAKDDVTVTKTGMIAGTPAYLAPEVAIGGNPGPESDIFSLGSTLYAACEGQPPFGLSENTLSLLHAVAAGQINPPRRSGPMASVLAVLLHPEVGHRPTAAEAEELLNAVANGETPLGGSADDPTRLASARGVLGRPGTATVALPGDGTGRSGTAAYYDDGYGRAVAYPADDYDRARHDDRYDDEYPPGGGPDHGNQRNGRWKAAAIAGVVAIALVGLVVWLFGSKKVDNTRNTTTDTPVPTSQPSTLLQPETPTEANAPSTSQSAANSRSPRHSSSSAEPPSSEETTPPSSSAKHSTAPPSSTTPTTSSADMSTNPQTN